MCAIETFEEERNPPLFEKPEFENRHERTSNQISES